ncbi:hypothetical protein ACFPN0_30900 [Kitasatospora cinereorecta]
MSWTYRGSTGPVSVEARSAGFHRDDRSFPMSDTSSPPGAGGRRTVAPLGATGRISDP